MESPGTNNVVSLDAYRLPEIDVSVQDLPHLAREAWAALKRANEEAPEPFLYQRGGLLTRIRVGDFGEPRFEVVGEDVLRGMVARSAAWCRRLGKGEPVSVFPPLAVVRDLMSDPEPPVPVVTRITEAPVYAKDGSLRTERGYDPASRTVYLPAPGFDVPEIPALPTDAEVKHAQRLLIDDLLGDFPFAGEAERAHAVAAMLLPFVWEMIGGPTPLHLIEAPSPGTGKTLLADVVSYPATGHPPATMSEGHDEDEWRKRLFAKLRTGAEIVLIDNVRRKLDCAALAAGLTACVVEERILGRSEMLALPVRCVWLATGNNVALSSEMARRTVRIRLDSKAERPWLRTDFRHPDLRGWAAESRSRVVTACLTLVQRWVAAGMTPGVKPLGMFEDWARVMGGILCAAGIPGFLENLDELYAQADEEVGEWRQFVDAWAEAFATRPVAVVDLFDLCQEKMLLESVLGDKGERSQRIRLGKAVMQARDRQFGRWRICQSKGQGMTGNVNFFRLVPVG